MKIKGKIQSISLTDDSVHLTLLTNSKHLFEEYKGETDELFYGYIRKILNNTEVSFELKYNSNDSIDGEIKAYQDKIKELEGKKL